jgi:hypothetical protein
MKNIKSGKRVAKAEDKLLEYASNSLGIIFQPVLLTKCSGSRCMESVLYSELVKTEIDGNFCREFTIFDGDYGYGLLFFKMENKQVVR